jgi:hypothetical protein
MLLGRLGEATIRLIPCTRRMRQFPAGEISALLRKEMRAFAAKELVIMLVGLVVWNRSDMIILKWRNPDLKQITFLATALNLLENWPWPREF